MTFLAILAALATTAAPIPPATRALHERLIVLDTHFDTPANFGREGWSIMDRHDVVADGDQVDLPRMIEGGVDGGFFVVYTPQGGRGADDLLRMRDAALTRAVQIREMVAKHADRFALAVTADDGSRIARAGRRFVYMSMENSAPVEADLTLMRSFRALGVTMMGPVHFANNGLADSATDKPEWGGLSDKGRAFVAEANRLGILLDGSHASDAAARQMIALSQAPIILSHSGVRTVFDHPRNAPDDLVRALAAKGGVIQLNAFSGYMIAAPKNAARDAALAALRARTTPGRDPSEAERRALRADRAAIDKRFPAPRATFDDFMTHLLHAIRLVGIDHVGISGDFDGGGGIDGLDDVTAYPRITAALVKAGYRERDIAKIWGGNALRVLRAAQAAGDPKAVPSIPETN